MLLPKDNWDKEVHPRKALFFTSDSWSVNVAVERLKHPWKAPSFIIWIVEPTTLFSNKNFDRLKKTSYIIYLQISPKFLGKRAEETKDIIDEKMLTLAFTEKDKMYVDNSVMPLLKGNVTEYYWEDVTKLYFESEYIDAIIVYLKENGVMKFYYYLMVVYK